MIGWHNARSEWLDSGLLFKNLLPLIGRLIAYDESRANQRPEEAESCEKRLAARISAQGNPRFVERPSGKMSRFQETVSYRGRERENSTRLVATARGS